MSEMGEEILSVIQKHVTCPLDVPEACFVLIQIAGGFAFEELGAYTGRTTLIRMLDAAFARYSQIKNEDI